MNSRPHYFDLYEALWRVHGVPEAWHPLLRGELQFPVAVCRIVPFDPWPGYPPALLPLWYDGDLAAWQGLWRHWFCPRKQTFVDLWAETYRATEIARSFDQLMLRTLLGALENRPDDPEVLTLAQQLNLPHIETLSQSLSTPLSPTARAEDALLDLPAFRGTEPLTLLPTGSPYTGDFPLAGVPLSRFVSEMELPVDTALDPSLDAPWLRSSGQAEVFDARISVGDLTGAWFSLNSSGWEPHQARIAMERLATRTDDTAFHHLSEAWLSATSGEFHAY